jgi:WD40 repeat protein
MASIDATARLWDAYTGALLDHPMTHDAAVVEAHWSPDGRRIVTASIDQTARVWDARTGVQIGAPLHHEGVVWSARFSADGKRIATASGDHTAQIWDAETHLALTGPMRHEWPVRYAVMSQDSAHVLTISGSRDKARIWPVLSTTDDDAMRLADLAEAVGGYRIDASNALVPLEDRSRALQGLRSEFGPHSGPPSEVDRVYEDLIVLRPAGEQ